jgi:hypothetical protein
LLGYSAIICQLDLSLKSFRHDTKMNHKKLLLVIFKHGVYVHYELFFGQNKAQKSHKTDRKQYKKFLDPLPTISNEH